MKPMELNLWADKLEHLMKQFHSDNLRQPADAAGKACWEDLRLVLQITLHMPQLQNSQKV